VVSAPYIDRLPPSRLARELEESARSHGGWDANSLVLRYAASRAHDVAVPFAGDMTVALSQVAAPALILPSVSDRLFGLDGARRIRDGIRHPTYAEIPTDLGHRAGRAAPETPEGDFINQQIRAFLAKIE
jgi:homoserine acetyltransferase